LRFYPQCDILGPAGVMKLYRIAICEDEAVFRKTQEKICRRILEKQNIEYSISVFESGAALWRDYTDAVRYDLVLLDILMDENGVELARKIRTCDTEAAIIFITSNPDFALQGYDVNALHYLLKPLDADRLERLIASDYQRRFQNNYLVFKSGTQTHSVPIKDIICIETVSRRAAITLPDMVIEYPGTLSELLSNNPQFIRCHKAFAVNIDNIRNLTKTDAVAVNGKLIPVSRTYLKDVQKALVKRMRDG